jgi:hypothetical protein
MSEVKVDTISERTAAGGVTIDGVLIKDSVLKIPGGSPGADKVLTSDASGNATWEAAASPAGRNIIINGDFDVWQRGTSFSISGAGPGEYNADRWKFAGNNFTGSLIRQSFASNQTDVPDRPAYYVRWINTTTMPAAEKNQFLTPIELTPSGFKLANQEITFSCWLKSVSGTIPDGNVKFIKESAVYPSVGAITTTWTKFTQTWTLWDSNQGYLWVGFEVPATYSLTNGLDIAHCKLELGSVATAFEYKTFGQELTACQRYFEKSYDDGTNPGSATASSATFVRHPTAGPGAFFITYKVPKRTNPTTVTYGRASGTSGKVTNMSGGASDITGTFISGGTNSTVVYWTSTGSETYVESQWTAEAEL